jgi:hypothetical protein
LENTIASQSHCPKLRGLLFKHSPESTLTAADWIARGKRWQRLSWLRGVAMYLAFFPLLLALTKTDNSHIQVETSE